MQKNFICFSCKSIAMQFTILHCDHIICSHCLNNCIKNFTQISIVQCTCGIETFCNEDSMRNSLRTPQMAQVKEQSSKIKQLQDSNTQVSNFFLQQSDIISKQNTFFLKNKQNYNTENLNYILNLSNKGYSESFLKTQPLNFDESLFCIKSQHQNIIESDNSKVVRAVKSIQSIRSLSPSQKVSEKVSSRKVNCKKSPKKVVSRIYTTHVGNTTFQQQNPIARQIQKQLKYLQIQHKAQLQKFQKTFKKVMKQIDSSFKKLISSLQKKLYQQSNVNNKSEVINQNIQSISQVIKQKYQCKVGKKLNLLNEKLLSHLKDTNQKTFNKQKEKRQTIFMIKDSGQKQITNQRKNSSSKKSQSKNKQCALYLAISPKSKNDKVVNYIDIIRKQPTKNSKKNLTKKTIKGQKIRIY